MWKTIRITVLLVVLVIVAGRTWLDRVETQSWKRPLWVGIYPLNADGSPSAQSYIADLSAADFASIATFFEREAHRFAVALDEPVHIELYPQGKELPPQLDSNTGPFGVMWWSLKMRWFAMQATKVPGRTPILANFSFTSALCRAVAISVSHRLAISGEMPAGVEKPNQLVVTTPGNPASRKVGTSGSDGERSSSLTAKARMRCDVK